MTPLEEQISQAEKRLAQMRTKLKKDREKKETRRKIIAGEIILKMWEEGTLRNSSGQDWFLAALNESVKKPTDRELFSLPIEPLE